MRLAVIGATGMVGKKMLRVLQERKAGIEELLLAASEKSVGIELDFKGESHRVQRLEEVLKAKPDFALFSAGKGISRQWTSRFAEAGIPVVDNSSAWRMEPGIKLVVPEVNGDSIEKKDKIIANPNCSTIQLVAVLAPLHRKYGLKRIVVSTYQSVTGSGNKGFSQLIKERKGEEVTEPSYPHPIDLNCLPHCDDPAEDGYTREEIKVINESRKILDSPELPVTCTAVRVPVFGGHSESVNVELETDFEVQEIRDLMEEAPGIKLQDDLSENIYPMPVMAQDKDEVFVGRIRKDLSRQNTLNLWVVSDNLRKGAATNAVQILERIREVQ